MRGRDRTSLSNPSCSYSVRVLPYAILLSYHPLTVLYGGERFVTLRSGGGSSSRTNLGGGITTKSCIVRLMNKKSEAMKNLSMKKQSKLL